MKRTRLPALLLLAALAAHGQQASPPTPHENLNAVLWTQRSAEFRALALQTFQMARTALKLALAQPNWTAALEQEPPYRDLPPAIVLDLDETVLDNSSFNAKAVIDGAAYSEEAWQRFVEKEQAQAIPGAAEFLNFAHSEGAAIFYITNRVCNSSPADHTAAVLRKLHFPFQSSQLLCKANAAEPSNKSPRRAKVASTHRIVLLLGDDLNDFAPIPSSSEKDRLEDRNRIVQANADKWGVKWFLIPNPMYGSWENAIGNTVKTKLDALRP